MQVGPIKENPLNIGLFFSNLAHLAIGPSTQKVCIEKKRIFVQRSDKKLGQISYEIEAITRSFRVLPIPTQKRFWTIRYNSLSDDASISSIFCYTDSSHTTRSSGLLEV